MNFGIGSAKEPEQVVVAKGIVLETVIDFREGCFDAEREESEMYLVGGGLGGGLLFAKETALFIRKLGWCSSQSGGIA